MTNAPSRCKASGLQVRQGAQLAVISSRQTFQNSCINSLCRSPSCLFWPSCLSPSSLPHPSAPNRRHHGTHQRQSKLTVVSTILNPKVRPDRPWRPIQHYCTLQPVTVQLTSRFLEAIRGPKVIFQEFRVLVQRRSSRGTVLLTNQHLKPRLPVTAFTMSSASFLHTMARLM